MIANLVIQKILREKFKELQKQNAAFTLRAFAQQIELPPGTVSGLMNGKRTLSRSKSASVLKKFYGQNSKQIQTIIDLFPKSRSGRGTSYSYKKNYIELDIEKFKDISDWHHFALISLLETGWDSANPQKISQKLGITPEEADTAVQKLIQYGFIQLGPNQTIQSKNLNYATTEDIPSEILKKIHAQGLQHAQAKMNTIPVEEREFVSLILSVDPDRLPYAKLMIREFCDLLTDYLESGDKKEVYRIGLQLYPLSKKYEEKNEDTTTH